MSNTHNGIFLSNADGTLKEYANNSGGGSDVDTSTLSNKTDISSIILAGSTNTTGETITAGTWFYLNGKPCVAKVDIASGATFTEGTNYEKKTIGAELAELNSKIPSGDLSNYLKFDPNTILTDLNNAPANSWIWFNSTMTHTPENIGAGFCITFKYLSYLDADYNVQLVFGPATGTMYFRTSVYGGVGVTNWSGWSKVTSTIV